MQRVEMILFEKFDCKLKEGNIMIAGERIIFTDGTVI